MSVLDEAVAKLVPVDPAAASEARARQDRLTKPPGSLGRVEDLGVQLCRDRRPLPATDPGAGPWSPCSPPTTASSAEGDLAVAPGGHGADGRQLRGRRRRHQRPSPARSAPPSHVVDVGVAGDVSALTGVDHRKVRPGTDDLATGPAMSIAEARAALDVGADARGPSPGRGPRCSSLTGDMGIGNTTASAAVIAASTRPARRRRDRAAGPGSTTRCSSTRPRSSPPPRRRCRRLPRPGVRARRGRRARDRRARRLHRRRGRRTVPVLIDGVIAAAAAAGRRGPRARRDGYADRRPSLDRARRDGGAAPPRSRARCSTSGCGSARGPAPASPSRSSRRGGPRAQRDGDLRLRRRQRRAGLNG